MGVLGDFLSPEAGQKRTKWRNEKADDLYEGLQYYLGPTGVPDKLKAVAELLQFTDAGDVYEAQAGAEDMRNAEDVWGLLQGAGRMATGITAAAVPVVGAKMANNLTEQGIDWLGSAVDDFMAGYDPNQLNANFRAFHGTTRPFSRFSSDATRFPEDNGAVFFTSERGIAEGFADGDGAPRILEAEFDLNDPLMVRAADGQTPIETWDYSNGSLAAQAKAAGKDGVIIEGPSGERMFAVFDANGINIIAENGKPINPATTRGQEILDLLSTNPSAVTDDMLDMGDPVLNARLNEYLWNNYDLPMDEASRMARAEGITGYHGTKSPADILDFKTGTIFDDDGEMLVSGSQDPNSFLGPHFASTPGPANRFAAGNVDWTRSRWAEGDGAVYPVIVRGRQSSVGAEGEIEEYILRHGRGDSLDLEDLAADFGDEDAFWDRYDSDEIFRWKNNLRALNRERAAGGEPELAQELADQAAERYAQGGTDIIHYPNAVEGGDAFVALPGANIRSRFARFDPRLAHLRNLNAGLAGLGLGAVLGLQQPSDERELREYLGGI